MAEPAVAATHWRAPLEGRLLRLRPLVEADFDALFAVASDPLIWEQHPERDRYRREKFEAFFRSGLAADGAYAISARGADAGDVLIGSSRYSDYRADTRSVEIGYTFLARAYWGRDYNRELKRLMLAHAFKSVETAYFVVGRDNTRSRRALAKIGASEVDDKTPTPVERDWQKSALYRITSESFRRNPLD